MGLRDDFDTSRERLAEAMKKIRPTVPFIKGLLVYGLYFATSSIAVTLFRSSFSTMLSDAQVYSWMLSLFSFVLSVAILYSAVLTFAIHSKSERADFIRRNPVEFDPRAEKQYILHSKFFWQEMAVIGILLALHPLKWTYEGFFQFHPFAEALPHLVKKLIVFAVYGFLSVLLSVSARMEARRAWGVIAKDLYKERLWKSIKQKKEKRFGYRRMAFRLIKNFVIYLIAGYYLPAALGLVLSTAGIAWMLLTTSGGVAVAFLIFICIFYLRALLKRAQFIRRLKSYCQKNGYSIFDLKRPYRSIFRDVDQYTFGVEGHGKTYYCRLIASVKRGNHITFTHDGRCTRTFALRLPAPRIAVRGRIVNMEESSESHGYEIAKYASEVKYTFESGEGTKIVIVNPVSAKLYYEKMGHLSDLDHGMSIGEYKIFTASSFLRALDLDCADRMEPAK